jgi:hypothetical protein
MSDIINTIGYSRKQHIFLVSEISVCDTRGNAGFGGVSSTVVL